MYYPSIFNDGFVDNLLDGIFKYNPYDVKNKGEAPFFTGRMVTDVKEYDDKYQLDIELPGFTKEDVKVELNDGYLIVTASLDKTSEENSDDQDTETAENGEAAETAEDAEPEFRYIRKERYYGKLSRRFFVGKRVDKTDIKARFTNGILTLDIPKEVKPLDDGNNFIEIE